MDEETLQDILLKRVVQTYDWYKNGVGYLNIRCIKMVESFIKIHWNMEMKTNNLF